MTGDETAGGAAAAERDAEGGPADLGQASAEPAEPSIEDLQAQLEAANQAQARARADYQNLQRRSAEERQEFAGYTLASVVLNFLPVLDDLNRAIESAEGELAEHPWMDGVRLVQQKFDGVLEAAGVTEIATEDVAFDPNVHEAMGYVAGPEGRVVHRLERGYVIGSRVVRASRVMVGDGSSDRSDEQAEAGPSAEADEEAAEQ